MVSPQRWWWFSFADPGRPQGRQFLGVAVVTAHDADLALMTTHRFGCNPGGETAFYELPADLNPPAAYRERLLVEAEVEELMAVLAGQVDPAAEVRAHQPPKVMIITSPVTGRPGSFGRRQAG